MIDVKMQNGELALDTAGRFIDLGDRDARFRRAVRRKTEQIFNEALADYDDTAVTVTQTGEHTLVSIRVNGEARSEEVVRF